MKVKPNLFLNMSPQTTEEGGLAFARNMKLDDDGNLVSDYGYKNISAMANYNIVGHIVGLDDKIYFFCYTNNVSKIVEYDEVTEIATPLTTAWTYNGGEIDGYVNTNQSGEKILTIGEYLSNGSNIPLKHINLSYANVADESLYCQAPKVPTTNLILLDTYPKAIPNGTYVFFIRYKIRKDVYTNWFLCSCPIFAGTSEKITTLQGGLEYINIHRDSAKSFIFQVNFSQVANKANYEEFQLGFIITHDEATDARIWKSFKLSSFIDNPGVNDNLIYFDYENVQEDNIDDLLETTYELYNVRNVTSFKNKLYISNYKESNFNSSELATLASKISVGFAHSSQQGSADVAPREIKWGAYKLNYNNILGYFDKIGNDTVSDFINTRPYLLEYKFSDFSKGDLKEKEDILHFDLKWNAEYDPDLMTIHNMVNNIYNKVIFGNDFDLSYDGGRIGLTEIAGGSDYGFWRFAVSNSPHPWYSKGLTFCYGSINDNDSVYLEYSKNHVVPLNINTGQAHSGYSKTWVSRDVGFTDSSYNFVRSNSEKEITKYNRFFYGYCYLVSGTNIYNLDLDDNFKNDNYVRDSNAVIYPFEAAGNINYDKDTFNVKDEIKTKLFNLIVSNVVGVDENNVLILSLTNADTGETENVKLNSLSVVFRSCEFKVESPEDVGTNDDVNYNKRFYVTLKSYDYTSIVNVSIKNKYIHYTDTLENYSQGSTLMPLSSYDVYAHFVDEHNIISNGVKIANINTNANHNNVDILSLVYSINNLPTTNYKSFFLSIANVGNTIIECFGYQRYTNGSTVLHILQCLEADALLYNINDQITIIAVDSNGVSQTVTNSARYYTSGHSTPIIAFGNCGFIAWDDDNPSSPDDWTNDKLYISISKSTSNEANNKLIKATPYIPLANTSGNVTVLNGFYNSYFCLVKKPSFDLSSSAYCAGNDVYSADRTNGLSLKDFDYYIQQQDSSTYCIRSNFNLNYLSLTEDVNDKIFSVGKASSGVKQVAKVLNSSILSFIYELKSMYKDFMNKTFKEYDSNYKIDFDNTIRVSHVLSDETFNNSIFKFAAIDYYNVPTDRGIIVNLFSIGNNIFVHTKSSFYKFDGNQTIVSNNSDIQLQESEPFDNGVTQIFDSEYGYGGIDTKQSGCITFDSYFFYDKSSNHIFAYGGNSQVQLIDGNIYKLLAYYKPKDCKTVHDELNCRVLFEFTSSRSEHASATYKTFTLSYNYKTKTFVSFHDLSLVNAFAGRHRTYSYKSALVRLFEPETIINTTALVEGMNVNQIFGGATTACIIEFGSLIYKKQATPFGIAIVLFPQNNIKEVVNSVKYVADVQQTDPETQSTPIYDVLVNPQVTRNNPVVNFYIVTDSCVSSLVNTNVDDTARPNTLLDYKGFKYEMGFWTSNFFRNNINKTNIYDYPQKYPNRALDADNNSLVYGRYFIFVFDFKVDTPIKFEEIFMNSNKY